MKRTLRSRKAMVSLLGAGALVAGCAEETTDVTFFESEAQCLTAASFNEGLDEADCRGAFTEAAQQHALAAPRYESRALCESQHGAGACGTEAQSLAAADLPPDAGLTSGEPQQAGGGSVFMPFLMGYMIGNALSPRGYGGAQPLYRGQDGQPRTASGRAFGFARPGDTVRTGASALAPTTRTRPAAPLTRAAVAQRGGFGAARSSGMSLRGFGG